MTTPVGALFYNPVAKPLSSNGTFMSGCTATFYLTGTTTAATIYADGALTTPLANPLSADASGTFVPIYLDPDVIYRVQIKTSTGSLISDTDPYIPSGLSNLTQQGLGKVFYPQTAAEVSASVTPVDYFYPQGDVRRYGPALDGVTDDTTELQNWVKVGGNLTFPVPQTAKISAALTLLSNTTITGVKGATILQGANDVDHFKATSQSYITIRGLHFLKTSGGSGTTVHVAGVELNGCTYCLVENCVFEGMQGIGVWFTNGTSYCTARGNTILNHLGSGNETADISIDTQVVSGPACAFNVVDGNFCYGAISEFGISCWDPDVGVLPLKNLICNNRIGPHQGYGILFYMPGSASPANTFNQAIGNQIEGILGNVAGNPNSGAGIYVVGNGSGGTQIVHNQIRNCCIDTSGTSLAPAGIGINSTPSGCAPLVIQGNVIEGMTQYHGILLTGVAAGASVVGNSITQPQANSTGNALQVVNSFDVGVYGNTISQLNTTTQDGIVVEALGASSGAITVANNIVSGGLNGIRTIQSGGNTITGLIVEGNHVTGCGGGSLVFDSGTVTNGLVANNNLRGTTNPAISQTACTSVRYSNNFVVSSGSVIVSFSGANTGSSYDKSNVGSGIGAGVSNAGTGLQVEQYGGTSPAAGTWAVGDRIVNSSPVAAGVAFWICTTAGTGGGTAVFKTISNT